MVLPWAHNEYQGETPQGPEEYDSDESREDDLYMVELVSSLTEEEVFGPEIVAATHRLTYTNPRATPIADSPTSITPIPSEQMSPTSESK